MNPLQISVFARNLQSVIAHPSSFFRNKELPPGNIWKKSCRSLRIVYVSKTTARSGTSNTIQFVAIGNGPFVVLVNVHVTIVEHVFVHNVVVTQQTGCDLVPTQHEGSVETRWWIVWWNDEIAAYTRYTQIVVFQPNFQRIVVYLPSWFVRCFPGRWLGRMGVGRVNITGRLLIGSLQVVFVGNGPMGVLVHVDVTIVGCVFVYRTTEAPVDTWKYNLVVTMIPGINFYPAERDVYRMTWETLVKGWNLGWHQSGLSRFSVTLTWFKRIVIIIKLVTHQNLSCILIIHFLGSLFPASRTS